MAAQASIDTLFAIDPDALASHVVCLVADINEDLIPRVAADLAMFLDAPEGEAVDLFIAEALREHLIAAFSRHRLTASDLADFDSIRRILAES